MKTKKIEIWEFVKRPLKDDYITTKENGKELINPYRHCVYYDAVKKVAVATDGYKLFVSKKLYKEEFAGKMMMKNGTEIANHKYVKYELVFPRVLQPYYVNLESLSNAIAKAKEQGENECLIRLDDVCFDPKFAELMLRYMVQYKTDTVGFNQRAKQGGAVVIESEDGVLLLMPKIPLQCIPKFDVEVELKGYMDYIPTWKR